MTGRNGVIVERNERGDIISHTRYIDDLKEGYYYEWYDNKQLKIEGKYSKDKKVGVWIKYFLDFDSLNDVQYSTFDPKNKGKYIDQKIQYGEEKTEISQYDTSQQLISVVSYEKEIVKATIYNQERLIEKIIRKNGKIIHYESQINLIYYDEAVEMKDNEIFTVITRGTFTPEISYKHKTFNLKIDSEKRGIMKLGKREGVWKKMKNRRLIKEISYENGIKNGYYIKYLNFTSSRGACSVNYDNIEEKWQMKNGKRDGKYIKNSMVDRGNQYHPSLELEGEYIDGRKNGKWIKYRTSQISYNLMKIFKIEEINYINDLMDGEYIRYDFRPYDREGNVLSKGYYVLGLKHGLWENADVSTHGKYIKSVYELDNIIS